MKQTLFVFSVGAVVVMLMGIKENDPKLSIAMLFCFMAIFACAQAIDRIDKIRDSLKETLDVLQDKIKSDIEDILHQRSNKENLRRKLEDLQDQALELRFCWHCSTTTLPNKDEQVLLFIDKELAEDNGKPKRFRCVCLTEVAGGEMAFVGPGTMIRIDKDVWWRHVSRPRFSKHYND
jgi:hypothetical protein